MINLTDYFARIGYAGTTTVNKETLFAIHCAHAFSIPFENLAIFDSNSDRDYPIRLDEHSLCNKLIYQRRGGYCFESSSLLILVLEQLGFTVVRLAGRVQQMLDHCLALVIVAGEKYIIDVGFGGNGLIEPLPLMLNVEVKQFSESFKLIVVDDDYILQVLINGNWSKLYSFRLTPYLAIDYEPLNYYISRFHPVLTHNRICTLPTPEGRIILHNDELKIRAGGQTPRKTISNNEYPQVLKEYFGIELIENSIIF